MVLVLESTGSVPQGEVTQVSLKRSGQPPQATGDKLQLCLSSLSRSSSPRLYALGLCLNAMLSSDSIQVIVRE